MQKTIDALNLKLSAAEAQRFTDISQEISSGVYIFTNVMQSMKNANIQMPFTNVDTLISAFETFGISNLLTQLTGVVKSTVDNGTGSIVDTIAVLSLPVITGSDEYKSITDRNDQVAFLTFMVFLPYVQSLMH